MPDFTPRVGFRKPIPTDVVSVVNDVNGNMDLADSCVGLFPCTTSTRPLNPHLGRLILVTDTGQVEGWTGTEWVAFGGGGAIGKMGMSNLTADSAVYTLASGEVGPHMSVTFTADAARRYWVESLIFLIAAASPVKAIASFKVRRAAGGVVTTAGTQIGSSVPYSAFRGPNGTQCYRKIHEIAPGISGTVTVGTFLQVTSGGSSSVQIRGNAAEWKNTLIVRDVGV